VAVLGYEQVELDAARHGELADVLAVWQGWCGQAEVPTWRNVDLAQLPPALLPFTAVVDLIDGGQDCRYRFWGTGIVRLYGNDATGELLSKNAGGSIAHSTIAQLKRVIDTARPLVFEVKITKPIGASVIKINLRLPIMDEPDTVTKVITVALLLPGDLSPTEDLAKAWVAPELDRELTEN